MKIIPKIIVILGLLLPSLSYAAPELITTWKAFSYAPANYKGKTLPVARTVIETSVLLVDNGKVISLAPYNVNWYAGEDRIAGGKGITTVRTTTPSTGQDSLELRVNIAKYNNQPLDAFITVPIVRPELLVMRKPNTKTQDLSVIPYFWNILTPAELVVTWEDNGSTLTARAANKKNEMEFAQISIPKQ